VPVDAKLAPLILYQLHIIFAQHALHARDLMLGFCRSFLKREPQAEGGEYEEALAALLVLVEACWAAHTQAAHPHVSVDAGSAQDKTGAKSLCTDEFRAKVPPICISVGPTRITAKYGHPLGVQSG